MEYLKAIIESSHKRKHTSSYAVDIGGKNTQQ